MPLRPSRRTASAALAGLLAVGAAAGTTPAFGAPSSDSVQVDAGITPSDVTAPVQVFGDTDPSTPETVSFVLRERHGDELARRATTPTDHFLSVAQFADRYGQDPATIQRLVEYLGRYGIHATPYANRITVVATGTAGQFDKALAVSQKDYYASPVPGTNGHPGHRGQRFHGTRQSPSLPRSIGGSVLAVLGLTNYSPFTSNAVHATAQDAQPQATSADSCVALSGLPAGCHTPSDFTSRYGLDPVLARTKGQGRTVGIVTLATVDPGAPEYFWNTVLGMAPTGRTVSYLNVDGGSGAPSEATDSGESDLDVEQSGAVAPGANLAVYQAPNTDFGFVDAYMSAASDNTADSVSASWGLSEDAIQSQWASGQEAAGYQKAFDEAFLELAVQGQSNFTSAADQGAYTAITDLKTTDLSVDSPADSPYVTAAGGTTLPWSGPVSYNGNTATVTVPAERAWGWDYYWPTRAALHGTTLADTAKAKIVGGGGGFSTLEPRPWYQKGVSGTGSYAGVQWLTPTSVTSVGGIQRPTDWTFDASAPVVTGTATGRGVPDISTNADPLSGYLIYAPSGSPALQGAWGGTSFVAPQLNGAAAVIDAALGRRTGLWNAALYRAAGHPGSPVTALDTQGTSNDNLFYTGTPGQTWNAATGLGVPDLAAVARTLGASRH